MARTTAPQIDMVLDGPNLHRLSALPGPWLTVLLPAYRKGEQQNPDTQRLKNLLRTSGGMRIPDELLAPVRELAEGEALASGGKGIALFNATDFAGGYRVDSPLGDRLIFSKDPFVKPVLAEAFLTHEAFALGLSRKRMRLLHYSYGTCEDLPFPARVPTNIQDALDTDQPDHDLANRSASGASTGSGFAVRFGTSSDRESAPEYLHHFFTIVDRGIYPVVKDAPLFLMGVAEEIAEYRKVTGHPSVLESEFDGSAESLSPAQIAEHLREAAAAHYRRQAEAVLLEFREMTNRSRAMQGLEGVLSAAVVGRIHRVVIADDVYVPAAHGPAAKDLMPGDELLNTIAVETIRNSGQVFTLSRQAMGDAAPVAAILRY